MENNLFNNQSDPYMSEFLRYVKMFESHNNDTSNINDSNDQTTENDEEYDDNYENDTINFESLLEDLSFFKEKCLSYTESDSDDESYVQGKEEGLYKAIEILEHVIKNKYERNI